MLTFNSVPQQSQESSLDELKGSLPDAIEIGETNDCWLYVRRSLRRIEVVSKQSGALVAFCPANRKALDFGVSLRQISAAQGVLRLK